MKSRGITAIILFCALMVLNLFPSNILAVEDWKKEFEAVCSKTENSMSLNTEELKQLVQRCDSLQTVIDSQDESTKKVYRKRLKLCRDLYDFVLKSREQEKK